MTPKTDDGSFRAASFVYVLFSIQILDEDAREHA